MELDSFFHYYHGWTILRPLSKWLTMPIGIINVNAYSSWDESFKSQFVTICPTLQTEFQYITAEIGNGGDVYPCGITSCPITRTIQ